MFVLSRLLRHPPRVVVLGLTGSIASGKSTRCRHIHSLAEARARQLCNSFATHSVNADKLGHEIYAPGKPCYYEILDAFGRDVLQQGGAFATEEAPIDRKRLGGIVFREPQSRELRQLNNMCWPHIQEAVEQSVEAATNEALLNKKNLLLVLLEAAVLIDSSMLAMCDDVWLTCCEKGVAVRRVMERDGLREAQATARVASHKDLETNIKFLDDIKFKGEVVTFDTTTVTISEGLRHVTAAFDTYWRNKLERMQWDPFTDKGCWVSK